MPEDYEDLLRKATRVRGVAPLAQIDIMDGIFVGSKSWPYTKGGVKTEENFIKLQHQEEALPFWEDIDYEIDLMINKPELHIDEWLPLGASRLIFHIEAMEDTEKFFAHDIFKEGARDIGGQKVIEVGLAINPTTPLGRITPFVSSVDFIQCMGISKIGYQKQEFNEEVLEQINQLRVLFPNIPISIDGGVNFETAPLFRSAGANRLVSGSVLFEAEDMKETIRLLQNS